MTKPNIKSLRDLIELFDELDIRLTVKLPSSGNNIAQQDVVLLKAILLNSINSPPKS